MADATLLLGDARVELDACVVRRGATGTVLTPLEARLLRHLATQRGIPASRDDLLREVWEYAEGISTQAVRACVRRLRLKIEPNPEQPKWLLTVRGVGWCLATSPEVTHQTSLPVFAGRFVGRDADLARLEEALTEERPVVLVGPTGVGKTRLACELASRWPTEVVFVDLSEASGLNDGRAVLARALDLDGSASVDAVARAISAHDRPLVVLDNLESVLDLFGDVPNWRRGSGGHRVLATSQDRPGLPGERVLQLGPLEPDAAKTLFAERCVVPVAERQGDSVARVVRLLEGLPLAIELVAARVALMELPDLETRIRRSVLSMAAGRPLGAPSRHQHLGAALEAAWARLPPDAQRALCDLAVFRGGFCLDAAEAMFPDGRPGLDIVQDLHDRSLLQVHATPVGMRYRLTRPVLEFASRALDSSDRRSDVEGRHAEWTLTTSAEALTYHGPGGSARRRAGAAERHNLWAVFERYSSDARGVRALICLGTPACDARAVRIEAALAQLGDPKSIEHGLRSELALTAAAIDRRLGRHSQEVIARLEHAEGLAVTAGREDLQIRVATQRASVALADGNFEGALFHSARGLELVGDSESTTSPADLPVHAELWIRRALALNHLGRADPAMADAARAVTLARRSGDEAAARLCLVAHAFVMTTAGQPQRAKAALTAAIDSAGPHDHDRDLLHPYVALAGVCLELNEVHQAKAHIQRAKHLQGRLGDQTTAAYMQLNECNAHLLAGDVAAAERALAECPTPPRGTVLSVLCGTSRVRCAWARGDDVAARFEALSGELEIEAEEMAAALACCAHALAGRDAKPPPLRHRIPSALLELVAVCAAAAAGAQADVARGVAAVGHRGGEAGHFVARLAQAAVQPPR